MFKSDDPVRNRDRESGSVLLMVAFSMLMLLGISALAIDLAHFYMSRAEAQRAADAAALAGAVEFSRSGCTSTGGCTAGGVQEIPARRMAKAAGEQNYVSGQPAVINEDSDIVFNYPTPEEPEISVTVHRNLPTFFGKVFGITAANVSATATAEAYNPSGGGAAPVAASCVKPFLVPNCDPDHTSPPGLCSGDGQFITDTGDIAHPGAYPAGVYGEPWSLHSEAGPSQWYLVGFTDAPPSSGAALREHIETCESTPITTGVMTLYTANGAMFGPADQGVNALIHASGDGLGQGQDSIDTSVGPPFPMTGGSNNPDPALIGEPIYNSDSIVTLPIYDGSTLPPGGTQVDIVGFMQAFILDAQHIGSDDQIDMIILNVSPADSGSPGGSGGGSGPIIAAGGSAIPVRLIRTN